MKQINIGKKKRNFIKIETFYLDILITRALFFTWLKLVNILFTEDKRPLRIIQE